jgi:phosphatidylglycerophosphatase C
MKKTIIIFDFCETLVPFQTGDEFLKEIILNHASFGDKLKTLIIINKFTKKILTYLNPNKKIRDYLLPKIKNIEKEKIDNTASNYAKKKLIPNINKEMKKILDNYETEGKKIMIVSAGYEEYIRYVFEEQKQLELIGTKLEYADGAATGKINGKICFGKEKVNRINNNLNEEIDQEESAVYSDCMSDFPMFSLVLKNRWLVKLPKSKNKNVEIKKIEF